ncbi:hypothetical protein EMIHUDRAFT_210636 [Emiliania huxleyi CCMP1516]|uniref:Uncharacterized protein n=2 Tax=Emiliania huxleyi TaxID=2903 RepID=A0A0D3IYG0_EMIH1|nr:hypothetical protein EMIHUDRAFT_210636 [Emiliania huxleyi CCMP1516]EOD16295.1 hypothetical protein EMIHUDRAFT_210636 [Emiliania huxleyi CCMP1516]|eukprot:XP_005768724.1 hypothetical protein EMIHUDRAFT_210636 [Emiliania huxleyi CCMP1516]
MRLLSVCTDIPTSLLAPLLLAPPASLPSGRRMARTRASFVDVAPASALPTSSVDPRLQSLLLKVLTVEAVNDPPDDGDVASLCSDLRLAGFEPLGKGDAALASSLRPTAFERLAVRPRLANLDASLAREVHGSDADELLYDGRVVLWRRRYGSESREGRLVLDKLDYLQQALVQRALVAPATLLLQRARETAIAASAKAAARFGGEEPKEEPSGLLGALLGRSNLSEPTYAELVVLWRRPASPLAATARSSLVRGLPAVLSATAGALRPDDEGSLSLGSLGSLSRADLTRLREDANEALAAARSRPPPPPPLEMRFFVDIPIANFALVLPDSRPAFQLSDWLRLDLISTPALVATLASLRYDDSRLDLASAIAVGAWALRTVFSFRSAYGRYELLLQRTISDKLSIRDAAEVDFAPALATLRRLGLAPSEADAAEAAKKAEEARLLRLLATLTEERIRFGITPETSARRASVATARAKAVAARMAAEAAQRS